LRPLRIPSRAGDLEDDAGPRADGVSPAETNFWYINQTIHRFVRRAGLHDQPNVAKRSLIQPAKKPPADVSLIRSDVVIPSATRAVEARAAEPFEQSPECAGGA